MRATDRSFRRAVGFAIATPFFGSIAGALAKHLQEELTVYSVLLVQYAVCLAAMTPWLFKVGRVGLQTNRPWLHVIRGFAGWGCYYLHYEALARIALVDGVTLRNTAPLFVPFIAWFALSGRLSKRRVAVAALGFLGVLLILKPTAEFRPWHLVGLGGGFLLAVSMVLTRVLSATEPRNRILFYYFVTAVVLTIPLASKGQLAAVDSPTTWALLIATGVSVYIALQCYTVAYGSAPTPAIAPFSYFGVLFGGLWSALFWNYLPDRVSATGIVLIVIAGVWTLRLGPSRRRE